MTNLDLQSFYRQAWAWKLDKDEQDRQRELQLQEELKSAWTSATREIRSIFPIEGIAIYEAEPHMTSVFPSTGGNYAFDVVLPGADYSPIYDENRSLTGVIRVVMNCYLTYAFKPVGFYVWVNGNCQGYQNSLEAFLACVGEMDLNLEVNFS